MSAPTTVPPREPHLWFPQTKLHAPLPGADTLLRPRLFASVRAAILTHRLTLIAAPAGAGKTTTVATLLRERSDLAVAWLALDADDNDPATFAAALLAAVRGGLPDCGGLAQSLFDGLPNPGGQLRRLLGVLINDLPDLTIRPLVLVLDDLHAITEPAIHEALDHLIERLPTGAHVAVTTRYDPPLALARLRARGQLAEVRLPDLRFTTDETGTLLNGALALDLAAGDVAILHDRTGGWAAGVRLLALMLGRLGAGEERRALIAQLGADGRYIFDFMAEEVLHQQEPELQRFLLDISILPELTPALCRAVTGRDDAGQLLDLAFRRNLFLTITGGPVSDTGKAYRLHDLFAVFLRERLAEESPDRMRELHHRAAEAATDASQAITHYCAAEAWDDAAQAIAANAAQFTRYGMNGRLSDWIAALPNTVREARPDLLLLLGTHAFLAGRWEQARPLLDRAQTGLAAAGNRAAALEALLLLISILTRTGDREGLVALKARAQKLSPFPARFQIFVNIGRAWDSMHENNYADVERLVAESVKLMLETDDPTVGNLTLLTPPLALGPSGPSVIEAYCQETQRRYGGTISQISAITEHLWSYLHLARGRLTDAAAAAERVSRLIEQLGEISDIVPGLMLVRYGLATMLDTPEAAERYVTGQLPQVERKDVQRGWLPGYRYLVAKARWLGGRLTEARDATDRLGEHGPYPDFPILPQAQALLYGMIATSEGRFAEAERHLLESATPFPPYFAFTFWLDHPQVLLAHCYERWGRPQQALETLRPVLEEYERLNMPGIIAKVGPEIAPVLSLAVEHQVHGAFAARLLGLLGRPGAGAATGNSGGFVVPGTGETLSPREVEVLRLLATGESNAAIGEALFISQNTVKTHVARILAKLGVASRTQAATRARDLGIG